MYDLTKDSITNKQLSELTTDQITKAKTIFAATSVSLSPSDITTQKMLDFFSLDKVIIQSTDDRGNIGVGITWTNGKESFFYAKIDTNLCDALWQHLKDFLESRYGYI